MDPEHGHIEQGFGHEIPIGDSIERVLEPPGEAELLSHAIGVQGKGRSGQGAGTQWGHVQPVDRGQ